MRMKGLWCRFFQSLIHRPVQVVNGTHRDLSVLILSRIVLWALGTCAIMRYSSWDYIDSKGWADDSPGGFARFEHVTPSAAIAFTQLFCCCSLLLENNGRVLECAMDFPRWTINLPHFNSSGTVPLATRLDDMRKALGLVSG